MQYNRCMQSYYNLAAITNIIAGYTFRSPIREARSGSMYILQAKNIKSGSTIDAEGLTRTEISTSHTNAFVVGGDVAIGSRGVFRAGVIWTERKVLAASSVFLLRVNNKAVVSPEYLAIYLNSIPGQRNIQQFLTNGTIKTLLKKDMSSIKIPIPTVEHQHQIISLDRNVRRQKELLGRKITAQRKLINGVFNQLERIGHE